eukprot:481140-Pyramimonas_sp.AAC.1
MLRWRQSENTVIWRLAQSVVPTWVFDDAISKKRFLYSLYGRNVQQVSVTSCHPELTRSTRALKL